MSVPKGKRGENKLEVLNLAAKAAIETIRYVKQEKSFPKRERWILAAPIAMLGIGAYICIKMANARYVEQAVDPESNASHDIERAQMRIKDLSFRINLEKIAHSCYMAQLGLIDIAYQAHEGLGSHTVEVWTGYILDADEALLSWIKSEKENMKKTGKRL